MPKEQEVIQFELKEIVVVGEDDANGTTTTIAALQSQRCGKPRMRDGNDAMAPDNSGDIQTVSSCIEEECVTIPECELVAFPSVNVNQSLTNNMH